MNINKINIGRKINIIKGQLDGVLKMIDKKDVSCDKVLIQLSAISSALHGVAEDIIKDNLKKCVDPKIHTDKKIDYILKIFGRI